MKVLSHDITHKTDVGGVALNIRSAPEAAKQYTKVSERVQAAAPEAKILGVAVQAMSRGGYEVIIGSKRDAPSARRSCSAWAAPASSSTATCRRLPARQPDARAGHDPDTKVSRLLEGYRGRPAVDMVALEQTLVKFSYLLVDFPEILEMDANPVQVRADGLGALDARIVIEPKDVRKIALPGSH